ncbi:MAG: HEAT repeat domain-containing protein [Anaerolineae bacterium]
MSILYATEQELEVLLDNIRTKVIDIQQIDIEPILALLHHTDAGVKFAAVEVLAELDERAVDHLYAIAQNEDIRLATSAISALGNIGGEVAQHLSPR